MIRIALWLLFSFVSFSTSAVQRVIHPALSEEHATRFEDLLEILEISLLKTADDFGDFELIPSSVGMTESRELQELKSGRRVDVGWSSTSPQKEKDLRPIRIPLRKGILGYRISFINKKIQYRIDSVNTLDDLRKFRVGQGIGWGDVKLYEHSEIIVEQAPYQSLFKMIDSNRFDLFPRGINEIFLEYEVYGGENPQLTVEKGLALYYPWPYYFFTSKNNEQLAHRIETGLKRMIKDGSFDRIFLKYNRKSIKQAQLKDRRLIRLENPFLPDQTPLKDAKLWFDPFKDQVE